MSSSSSSRESGVTIHKRPRRSDELDSSSLQSTLDTLNDAFAFKKRKFKMVPNEMSFGDAISQSSESKLDSFASQERTATSVPEVIMDVPEDRLELLKLVNHKTKNNESHPFILNTHLFVAIGENPYRCRQIQDVY